MYSITKLYIYLQNVCKNYILVDTFLESQKDYYNIFFIQEPLWNFIHYILSTTLLEGDRVVGASIYLDQTQIVQPPKNSKDIPQVIAFIHSCLSGLRFSLRRDVINHCNILLLSFFDRRKYYFFINVYLDNHHSAIKFMLDQVIDIPNLLYMDRDFNIRDIE